jgi:hypothetical protein
MDGPIFVVGAPRSGTTFLRVTLNRHPSIELSNETNFFYKIWQRRAAFGDLGDRENRQRLVDQYLQTRNAESLDVDLQDLGAALLRNGVDYKAFFTTLIRQPAAVRGKRRFGEKTPYHSFFSETLCDWYPDAALIHVVRDPRAVAASLKRVPFGSPEALANARAWTAHVEAAQRAQGRPNYLLVKYEQLVSEPEAELRRITSFIGEEFAASMLEAGGAPADTPSWSERAHRPIQHDRIAKWRNELTRSEAALVEWAAGPAMTQLGYAREAEAPAPFTLAAASARALGNYVLTRAKNPSTIWHYWFDRSNLAADDAAWRRRVPSRRTN